MMSYVILIDIGRLGISERVILLLISHDGQILHGEVLGNSDNIVDGNFDIIYIHT